MGDRGRGQVGASLVDFQNIPLLLLSFITATLSTTASREALDWGMKQDTDMLVRR